MKDLYIVSKAFRGRFTESLYQFITLFNFLIHMSIKVKI